MKKRDPINVIFEIILILGKKYKKEKQNIIKVNFLYYIEKVIYNNKIKKVIKIKSRLFTFLEGILSMACIFGGLAMLWFLFSGDIVFNDSIYGIISFNVRTWVILSIALFSCSQLFIGKTYRRRILATLALFFGITLVFLVIGGAYGFMNAAGSGVFEPTSFWIIFNSFGGLKMYADIKPGLQVKTIVDFILYALPSVALLILIVQMLLAGDAHEFIKAFLEGVAVVIFIVLYTLVGGVPFIR